MQHAVIKKLSPIKLIEKNLDIIDPTELNDEENLVLKTYLLAHKHLGVFSKNHIENRSIVIENINYHFKLTHTILYKPRNRDINQHRFHVCSNEEDDMQSGGIGRYVKIAGTLTVEGNAPLIFDTSKKRGCKEEFDTLPIPFGVEVKKSKQAYRLEDYADNTFVVESGYKTYTVSWREDKRIFSKVFNKQAAQELKRLTEIYEEQSSLWSLANLLSDIIDKCQYQPLVSNCAQNEFDMSRKISYLHAKSPITVVENEDNDFLKATLLIMKDLPGMTLEEALNTYKFSKIQILTLICELCRNLLEHFHDQGLLHLDLKPSNVQFDPKTQKAVFFDLGFSQAKGKAEVVGKTPYYASQEQFFEDTDKNDCGLGYGTDVYSLGKIFSEMMKMPFRVHRADPVNEGIDNQSSSNDFSSSECESVGLYEESSKYDTEFDITEFDLSDPYNAVIYENICEMTKAKIEQRADLTQALEKFERLLLMKTIEEKGAKKKQAVINKAYELGLHIWRERIKNSFAEMPLSFKFSVLNIQLTRIENTLAELGQTDIETEAFLLGLGIEYFNSAKNKTETLDKVLTYKKWVCVADHFAKDCLSTSQITGLYESVPALKPIMDEGHWALLKLKAAKPSLPVFQTLLQKIDKIEKKQAKLLNQTFITTRHTANDVKQNLLYLTKALPERFKQYHARAFQVPLVFFTEQIQLLDQLCATKSENNSFYWNAINEFRVFNEIVKPITPLITAIVKDVAKPMQQLATYLKCTLTQYIDKKCSFEKMRLTNPEILAMEKILEVVNTMEDVEEALPKILSELKEIKSKDSFSLFNHSSDKKSLYSQIHQALKWYQKDCKLQGGKVSNKYFIG